MGICALFGDLNDLTPDCNVPIGIFWILDRKRDPFVAAHVLVFETTFGGIHSDMAAVVIDQTGVTCGLPSGMQVAKCANATLVKRSLKLSGIVAAMIHLL